MSFHKSCFEQKFDYNKIIDKYISKSQITFYHNPKGFKKGTIVGTWTKLFQTNDHTWILRKVGGSEDEIWNRMKPAIRKRILENFENLITWTDYVGNDFTIGKYKFSKEKTHATKKLQIVVKDLNNDTIETFDI